MDKKKVLILGNGRHGDISSWVARAFGELAHYGIEQIDIMVGQKRADLLVCDEMSSLAGVDFSAFEERMLGLFDAVSVDGVGMINTATGQTVSGRQMYWEPEPQRLPRTHTQQSIYEMLAIQTGRGIAPDVEKSNRLFAMGYNPSLMICDEYTRMGSKPADHPSRKREPKGPRGKWGKL